MAALLALGGCNSRGGEGSDYALSVDRSPETVVRAIESIGRDVGGNGDGMSMMPPFLTAVHLRVEHPDAATIRIVMPGDEPAKDIPFTFTVKRVGDGQHSELHVIADMPATIGSPSGPRKPIDGRKMAGQLQFEATRMVEDLNKGRDAIDAAMSMKLAMHSVAMDNRTSTRAEFDRASANIDAYAKAAGRKAASDYLDRDTKLTPQQREAVRASVLAALDKH